MSTRRRMPSGRGVAVRERRLLFNFKVIEQLIILTELAPTANDVVMTVQKSTWIIKHGFEHRSENLVGFRRKASTGNRIRIYTATRKVGKIARAERFFAGFVLHFLLPGLVSWIEIRGKFNQLHADSAQSSKGQKPRSVIRIKNEKLKTNQSTLGKTKRQCMSQNPSCWPISNGKILCLSQSTKRKATRAENRMGDECGFRNRNR